MFSTASYVKIENPVIAGSSMTSASQDVAPRPGATGSRKSQRSSANVARHSFNSVASPSHGCRLAAADEPADGRVGRGVAEVEGDRRAKNPIGPRSHRCLPPAREVAAVEALRRAADQLRKVARVVLHAGVVGHTWAILVYNGCLRWISSGMKAGCGRLAGFHIRTSSWKSPNVDPAPRRVARF